MSLVTITVNGEWAKVRSPYDPGRVDVIKSMPERKWDGTAKVWTIPADDVDELAELLRGFGDMVTIAGGKQSSGTTNSPRLAVLQAENERLRQETARLRKEASASHGSWAEQLLAPLNSESREKAYKKLSSVVHPDAGGDNALMRDLNVAFDMLADRSRQ